MGIESDKRPQQLEGVEGRGTKVGSEGQNQPVPDGHHRGNEQERQRNADIWAGVSVPSTPAAGPDLSQEVQAKRNRDLFEP